MMAAFCFITVEGYDGRVLFEWSARLKEWRRARGLLALSYLLPQNRIGGHSLFYSTQRLTDWERGRGEDGDKVPSSHTHTHTPVSYTHLTLPTKLSV